MLLSFEQIRNLIHGAARVVQLDDCIGLKRFTQEQAQLIREYNDLYDTRARTTAGVTLEMETDSRNLFLSVEVSNAFRNLCFSHSILVNGKRIGELRGSVPKESQTVAMEAQFDLGPGSKLVQIVFPWSANSMIKSLQIDDGARVVPVAKKRKMLIFGDSISQGYDAYYPENAYAVRLTQYLNASAINKSIGGIKYYPQLAKLPDEDQPDIIVVSYGGNDFHGGNKEIFEQDSVLFCQNLRDMYPTAKIIVMMPFCNGSRRKNEPLWYFCELQDHLRGLSARIENLCVIESSDFIGEDATLFHGDGVHPLDSGHDIHFCGIVSAIQQQI